MIRILLLATALVSVNAAELTLKARRRDASTGQPSETQVKVDPKEVAVIAVDMWNWHWCKTSTMRVAALVPRMDQCLKELRQMGVQVFMCPTDVADNYIGTPQVESVLAVKPVTPPKLRTISCPPAPDGGGCTCGPGHRCAGNYGWDGMHPDLYMADTDLMPNDPAMLYAILKERGIKHLIFMGVHTQVCLLGKSVGMRAMLEAGFDCFLARDLTDAHGKYDPATGLTPDKYTAMVVEHFEKHLSPTIDMMETLRAAGKWDRSGPVDQVRIAPWGTVKRPHHFEDKVLVALSVPEGQPAEIHYRLNGSAPQRYAKPIEITETTTLEVSAPGYQKTEGRFVKQISLPPAPTVLLSSLAPQRSIGPGHSPSFRDHRFSPVSNPPQMNLSNRKQPMRIRGKTYDRGIGVHAPCQLIYELKPEYTRFVALAGVDDRIVEVEMGSNLAMHPSVIFRVFIDGKMAAESPIMKISEPAWRFDVPIPPGSRMISLAATDAGDGNKEDLADWVECGFVTK